MRLIVRPMRADDARAALQVHHEAVHGTAANDYPRAVLDDWAPLPITDEDVRWFGRNADGEIRIVAEAGNEIVGFAALVPDKRELRACYVAPTASRRGVGRALVRALERSARRLGLPYLQLNSSVTAEPFYLALGYEVLSRGEHTLASGRQMACVHMQRSLRP